MASSTLAYIILATALVSVISLVGVLTIPWKAKKLEKALLILVGLSAGALMGGAFIHLIPEAVEMSGGMIFTYVLIGFVLFFLLEKVIHWRHCHKGKCSIHGFAYMNLVGDSVHNFIDGLIIAAAFVVSVPLGISTAIAVALHEIPQEIGDFGVLLYGGFNRSTALFLNFVTGLTAVAGGIIGFYLAGFSSNVVYFLIPFAAGGFIYISASDLIPEIRKEKDIAKALSAIGIFILGMVLMYVLALVG
jgi:zinc and cadmium transporter